MSCRRHHKTHVPPRCVQWVPERDLRLAQWVDLHRIDSRHGTKHRPVRLRLNNGCHVHRQRK